ncbi:MAG: 30S ribosomal protein S15 [Candidatus Yonathbacteria bacterium RIFCSPHIGHO2_01_FULL_51_10]|uniref:Small ribosomal subunit protein uS15 n=1 Tax=Candidatus Yonathbacteria bacterium RIFCSPHIGHO2_01_FULL_51_10 TaxID=1802723 RepID=A0A1G2S3C2_9BACT|nr:MAG: 30S ribosomal protein S15 [Candidatus Yonathbacteria bacterium RIFCSPHIGHO2_01_FULL_51_10]
MLTTRQKQTVMKKTARHDKDTGSPEVQISILTKKITELADHLKKNHKDNHSRRGLLKMVADRHTHLKYLKKKHLERYEKVTKELGLK